MPKNTLDEGREKVSLVKTEGKWGYLINQFRNSQGGHKLRMMGFGDWTPLVRGDGMSKKGPVNWRLKLFLRSWPPEGNKRIGVSACSSVYMCACVRARTCVHTRICACLYAWYGVYFPTPPTHNCWCGDITSTLLPLRNNTGLERLYRRKGPCFMLSTMGTFETEPPSLFLVGAVFGSYLTYLSVLRATHDSVSPLTPDLWP